MNNFSTALIKFSTAVKNDITFESAAKYLNERGIEIIFANTPNGDKRIYALNIADVVKGKKSITVYKKNVKCVVINNNLSSEDKLFMILHEIGHILLGHIDTDYYNAVNNVKIDNEAEAFTYLSMHTSKSKYIIYKLIKHKNAIISCICMSILISAFAVGYVTQEKGKPAEPQTAIVSEDVKSTPVITPTPRNTAIAAASANPPDNSVQMVYVTPTGKKYHKYSCHTIDKNTAIEISIDKAKMAHLEPCKICNPDK